MNVHRSDVKALQIEVKRLVELGKYEEALSYLNQALLLDPKNITKYSNKAMLLLSLHRYEDALTVCDQALRFAPDNPVTLLNKSSALIHLRRFEEALSVCRYILLLKPQDTIVLFTYINIFVALSSLQRMKEAEEAYRHIQHDPNALKIVQTLLQAIQKGPSIGKLE